MPGFNKNSARVSLLVLCAFAIIFSTAAFAGDKPAKATGQMLKKSYRFERAHWIYVHLEGTPAEIGYQHGWWLALEIEDALAQYKLDATHKTKREWTFFRETARDMQWPHIEAEYREELEGISRGLMARGHQIDLWDVVALNAMEEIPDYYVPWLNKREKRAEAPNLVAPGHCSAFVATGTWTKDHKPVIAHNNWTSIMSGERWRIIFDIAPAHGQRILMDGFPGVIASDDDFGINVSGLAVTETTISNFHAFDPDGAPEFVRARKALQYATSIDEYVAILLKDNNGGYANDWLLADYKTGEIAQFEIGLRKHRVWRTKDGYFAGSNFASDPELIKEETSYDPANAGSSMNARHKRWDELLTENKGKIDAALAQTFLADHYDSFEARSDKDERTLCGHINLSPRGAPEWEAPPFNPDGAVNAKALDSNMAARMSFVARTGFPCGEDFLAEQFLKAHPEFEWQRPELRDMKGNPWAEFKIGDKR